MFIGGRHAEGVVGTLPPLPMRGRARGRFRALGRLGGLLLCRVEDQFMALHESEAADVSDDGIFALSRAGLVEVGADDVALRMRSSSSMRSMTAEAVTQATGLPPKVAMVGPW